VIQICNGGAAQRYAILAASVSGCFEIQNASSGNRLIK
jgi:hypothetical protein